MKNRRITISLSPPALVGGLVSLCAGFVLVFSLGVLLGRGYNLETRIPKLERILPERATPAPPQIIAEDEKTRSDSGELEENGRQRPRATPERHTSAGSGMAEENRPSGVISQGDLEYRDNLKQSAPLSRPAAPPKPQDKPKPQEKAPDRQSANAQTPAGQRDTGAAPDLPLPGLAPERTAPVRTSAQEAAGGNTVSGDTQMYHYVYQAAAYKDEASCAAFTDRLKRAGLKARMEKSPSGGVIWYRTVVDFTGKPDDTDTLREKLKNHGVPRVILKSKTPAG
jgi:cell division protein FtsN